MKNKRYVSSFAVELGGFSCLFLCKSAKPRFPMSSLSIKPLIQIYLAITSIIEIHANSYLSMRHCK